MHLDKRGAGAIAGYEAVYLYAYPDPGTGGEPITIGIGHTAAAGGMRPRRGQRITLEQAFAIFRGDMASVEKGVLRAVSIPWTQDRLNALTSFHFNTGAIRSGTVDDKLNRGDFAAAMDTLQLYVNAGGRRMNGLVKRRREERATFERGVYPSRGILLREHPNGAPRTLSVERIPWGDNPSTPINITPQTFDIPPLPEKKPVENFIMDILQLIWRFFNEKT